MKNEGVLSTIKSSGNIRSNLNKHQLSASAPDTGITLVIAGAGTGKTKTLIEKVKNVISSGIADPRNILILTFSNKAAQEIKDRLILMIGGCANAVSAGTFHSFCLKFLSENLDALKKFYKFRNFPGVLDDDNKNKIQKQLLQNNLCHFLGLTADVITGLAENYKRLDERTYLKLVKLNIIEEIEKFNNLYGEYKITNSLIDFNDMMDFSINIIQNDDLIKDELNSRYGYIFIDEFQDTSEENFRLIKLLINHEKPNLFFVGDDWQSIYGFRDSEIDYIINMKYYFPAARVHRLETNYRSRKEIVDLSNKFISINKMRTSKKLEAFKGKGGVIKDYPVNNHAEECNVIMQIIESVKNDNRDEEIAVLYRNNRQGRFISEILSKYGMQNTVYLMTMHASKGLEFNTIIIAGISDKIIPDPSNDIEEERRLLYVGLTRAMEKLFIIHHVNPDGSLSLFAGELGLKITSL